MRLINVVTVWAQCHFFKKKKKEEPIAHMTSRQLSSVRVMSRMSFLAHKVNVSKWGVQHAQACRRESEAEWIPAPGAKPGPIRPDSYFSYLSMAKLIHCISGNPAH